ncbi:hypothetical protein, partial [Staphylococcus auricularis]|uniref:hypothetical protein n=1 Tax=Staphylococcus auricularis TaxID=29379 RepID=UPI001CD91966
QQTKSQTYVPTHQTTPPYSTITSTQVITKKLQNIPNTYTSPQNKNKQPQHITKNLLPTPLILFPPLLLPIIILLTLIIFPQKHQNHQNPLQPQHKEQKYQKQHHQQLALKEHLNNLNAQNYIE